MSSVSGLRPSEYKAVRMAAMEWERSRKPMDRLFQDVCRELGLGSDERQNSREFLFRWVRHYGLVCNAKLGKVDLVTPKGIRNFEAALQWFATQSGESIDTLHLRQEPLFETSPLRHLREMHSWPDMLEPADDCMHALHDWLHVCQGRAPVSIRVSERGNENSKFKQKLVEMGCVASPWVRDSWHVLPGTSLAALEQEFPQAFVVQDEHSQLVGWAVGARPGDRVLDLCAGAGGKTLLLAEHMKNRGELVAYDVSTSKLSVLHKRVRAAGYNNVRVEKVLPTKPHFDLVLVDAPCTSLGTLRRTPDLLWGLSSESLLRLQSTQRELLLSALRCLRPGGRVVYATCTYRYEENEAILKAAQHLGVSKPKVVEDNISKGLVQEPSLFWQMQNESPFVKLGRQNSFTNSQETTGVRIGPCQRSGGPQGDGFFVGDVHSKEV